jgi:hypothetical protein
VLQEDSVHFTSQKNPVPCQLSGRRVIPSGRPSVQSIIRPVDVDSRPDLPLCREASNCSSLHPSGRFSSLFGRHSVFDQSFRISFQNTNMGRSLQPSRRCGFPLDTLIQKASIAIQIQTSGCQSSWSERASIRYGNCMHQISLSDNHPLGPDTRSLYMEITCSGRETVRTTGHHRSDAAHFRKEF